MTDSTTQSSPRGRGTLLAAYLRAMTFLAGASMAAIVGIMLVQIVARYVFNASLIWAEEMCRYILVWQTFLFIGLAYHHGELVVLDFLSDYVSPRVRLAIKLLVSLPVCYFLYILIKTGLVHASRYQAQNIPAIDFIWTSLTGQPARVPVFWVYISAPLGCAILLAHLGLGLIEEIRRVLRASTPSPPSAAA